MADIIDNSISANAGNIWITSIPDEDPYVSILDDGEGLSSTELQEAMRYGSDPGAERSSDDLGRFGLGMKMASLSQCRVLTVISKIGNDFSSCRWDLDRVNETNQWTLQILEKSEVSNMPQLSQLEVLEHGTLVVWQKLDKIIERSVDVQDTMTHTLKISRDHLSLVFHRFMDSKVKPLRIYLNGALLEPFDPFLSSNTLTAKMQEQVVEIQGQVIRIKPFILPPESRLTPADIRKMGGNIQRNLQGFWVYRNKRLIIPGTWFRLSRSRELTKLARVMVDIPNTLDSIWDIDVKKSSATVPAQFQLEFGNVLDKVVTKSERKYKFKGRKENSGDKCYVWDKISLDKQYYYKINTNHPIIKEGFDKLDEENKKWFMEVIRMVESSVPYHDMYCMMADSQLNMKPIEQDFDNLLIQGIYLLEKGIPLDEIRNTEPFMGRKDVMSKLEEYNAAR